MIGDYKSETNVNSSRLPQPLIIENVSLQYDNILEQKNINHIHSVTAPTENILPKVLSEALSKTLHK